MTFDPTLSFKSVPVLDKGSVELFDAMLMDPRLKVVNSARVSFNKTSEEFSEKDAKLVKYLYEHGHFSTYRHSYFSFRIKAPLFVFRQWWKYQVGSSWEEGDELGSPVIVPDTSWNEQSGRYTEFKPEFYVPEKIRKQSASNKQGSSNEEVDRIEVFSDSHIGEKTKIPARDFFLEACQKSFDHYNVMVEAGAAKEVARLVLPQNIYSECIWTCSLQTLIHFFNQRLKQDAQLEIRQYARAIFDLVEPLAQGLVSDPSKP